MKALSRIDESAPARWWWSVDHTSLGLIAALATIGVVLILAAGPGAAARLGIADPFHFPIRQMAFLLPALAAALAVSMLTPLQARRLGSALFIAALGGILATLAFAPEINGARRWLPLGAFSFQPSEFLKPGFIIVAAWMMAERARHPRFPGMALAFTLFILSIALLVMQPDYGQAALLAAIFMAMFFVAGGGVAWLGAFALLALLGGGGAYLRSPHFAQRIDGFLNPEAGDNYQVDRAIEAIANGGLVGGRDGEAVKLSLPDAHTDFIFAVAAEEFGMALCLLILALFAAFVVRALFRASEVKSVFVQSAVCGLGALIGLQSFINIAVNLRMLPAKGMTLPFISYGGSSLIATGITAGLVLALTRRQSRAESRKDVMP